ncbi:MAG: hypothetical protein CMG00_07875 [Candidatus Marinimicrobia bacterium]|nr:hypothetical protein [Candidatus Neomarinimicrobiota bacterium]|tara:strand:- start:2386 stop:2946 length:561 start_codon:yes stop_codon:yes gene_type:complete
MPKNLKIALIFLIALISIYFFSQNSQNQYTSKETSLLNIDSNQIYSFTITNPVDQITISRIDSTWEILNNDTLTINQNAIDSFLDKVINVKKSTLISKNKEKWNIYSIDDSSATYLSILNDKEQEIAGFYLGRSKTNYANNYIRTNNSNNVYLTSENIFYYVTPIANYWGTKPISSTPNTEDLQSE